MISASEAKGLVEMHNMLQVKLAESRATIKRQLIEVAVPLILLKIEDLIKKQANEGKTSITFWGMRDLILVESYDLGDLDHIETSSTERDFIFHCILNTDIMPLIVSSFKDAGYGCRVFGASNEKLTIAWGEVTGSKPETTVKPRKIKKKGRK